MGDTHDKEPLQPGNDRLVNTTNSEFGYEELSNGLTCPTCQGTGKIPRGQEDDLVALIPYRDDRLKPRRTTLYVCIAVFICMAVAGILCAFLIPRTISFKPDRVETVYSNLNGTGDKMLLTLRLMNYFNVSNQNFLSLQITNATMQVISTFKGHVINDQKMQVIGVKIPLRSNNNIQILVNVTIDEDDFPLAYCEPSQGVTHGIYMIFQTTIYYHFMFQDSQSSLTHYQLVNCVKPKWEQHQRTRRSIRKRRSAGG